MLIDTNWVKKIYYYVYFRSLVIAGMRYMLAMMDQLISGLMLFGVLEQMKHRREVMASVLTLEGAANFQLTSNMILDNLTMEFSPEGSNKKAPEINVHKYFCDYVQELETREGIKEGYKIIVLCLKILYCSVQTETK